MFYCFARFICRVILAVFRRWEVRGAMNIPAEGGLILVVNHISYWDPVVVGCAIDRKVHFMAKSELFNVPLLGPVILALGTFPVRRDKSDRTAVRTAIKLLEEGHVVGVFPEGTRSRTGELLKPHRGAAMLAMKAGVPMLPVAVSGTKGFFSKIIVNMGKPLLYGKRERVSRNELENAGVHVMTLIAGLLEEAAGR
ncbi:MAG: 1-acyl-sn-glycerol-3-phosphate acyltransferase [Pelotomaculum sp. PtaU1.Bin035]|nr:MAG: 1-acyl-sn-glycerol-3-phosphate acyltransferase [Pelotomaculum sp. PtaU1.Bin035]